MRLRFGVAAAAGLMMAAVTSGRVDAAIFTDGNLVVLREGNGVADPTASTAAAAVSIREFTPAGELVQSIELPTSGVGAFTVVGNNLSDGGLQFSADGRYLTFTGYRANAGGAVLASTPRMIGRIDDDAERALVEVVQAGSMNTAVRGAASLDGSGYWISTSGGGPRFLPHGQTTGTGNALTSGVATRQVGVFGGNLYAAVDPGDGGTGGILRYNGVPTFANAPATKIVDGPTGGFYLADLSANVPGVDTLWAIDILAGEIKKFSMMSGGAWVANGSIASNGAIHLTGDVAASGEVTLFGSQLTKVSVAIDAAGYNAPNDGVVTDIAGFTPGENFAFKGITTVGFPEVVTPATPEPGAGLVIVGLMPMLLRRRRR